MATKKELEARIAALEVEIALLKAAAPVRPLTVLPRPSDTPWPSPSDWNPYWPPKIWCGTGQIVSSDRTFTTFNGAVA